MKTPLVFLILIMSLKSISQDLPIEHGNVGLILVNGVPLGTGFCAGKFNWIITAAHVVESDSLIKYLPSDDSIAYDLELIKVLEPYDIAVFTSKYLPKKSIIIRPEFDMSPGDSIVFVGYNDSLNNGIDYSLLYGKVAVEGLTLRFPAERCHDLFYFLEGEYKNKNFDLVEKYGIHGGFSGGPVFDKSWQVVGLMIEAFKSAPIGAKNPIRIYVNNCAIFPVLELEKSMNVNIGKRNYK